MVAACLGLCGGGREAAFAGARRAEGRGREGLPRARRREGEERGGGGGGRSQGCSRAAALALLAGGKGNSGAEVGVGGVRWRSLAEEPMRSLEVTGGRPRRGRVGVVKENVGEYHGQGILGPLDDPTSSLVERLYLLGQQNSGL